MLILVLTFVLLFLAVFAACLYGSGMWAEMQDLKALEKRQRQAAQRDIEAAWVRNRHATMD